MRFILFYIKTIKNIGYLNVLSVLVYRIFIKSFLVKLVFPQKKKKIFSQSFFKGEKQNKTFVFNNSAIINYADSILNGNIFYYSYHFFKVGHIPNWFINPFNRETYKNSKQHWASLNDFDPKLGDIKNVWELSRFNWSGTLAIAYKNTNNFNYLNKLNDWTQDWAVKNPQNTGPNWKCGQEASIRGINILLANEIVGSKELKKELYELLSIHLDRIRPTTFYAKAQDNNHGISEGVALYLLGYFLWKKTHNHKYFSLHRKGQLLIENRVDKLIMADGTFSQYSIVYHRMVLDLLSMLELFRKRWGLDCLSENFYNKCNLAVEWFSEMIDKNTGNAPNMGANDGTYLFNYDQKDFRDFRPSLVLASSIFNIPIDDTFRTNHCLQTFFSLKPSYFNKKKKVSKEYLVGGYTRLERDGGRAIIRIPKYKFRPPHSDALHIDIWQDGINWVRASGTFSYALSINEQASFSGTKGHSTVQFDGQDQMPKISRFLFGNWLKPSDLLFDNKNNVMTAGYKDQNGNSHFRKVKSIEKGWEIIDDVKGKFEFADLRWILKPEKWNLNKKSISYGNSLIEFESNKNFELNLKEGYESLYYMEKSIAPILEITFQMNTVLRTTISFN